MPPPLLATKLFIPPLRSNVVSRPRLTARLEEGCQAGRKLTLISAPAGFGKTTLVCEWLAGRSGPAAWLSLDEGENDPARFLTYFVAALRTVVPEAGTALLKNLQATPAAPSEELLAGLVNELASFRGDLILVLDDYHLVESPVVDEILGYLIEGLPPSVHLVVATREDPHLPLARLRARGQLTELRAADLRFSESEAAGFLNRAMGLSVTPADIAALERRTEGWIAGLQLAAISLQGLPDADAAGVFIQSFTGSHHFVLDYLVEEVINQQPEEIQGFLLRTSLLDRLCPELCAALLEIPTAEGRDRLRSVERANLFVIPLDNDRRWYRYHHLFAELLRQRLALSLSPDGVAELHRRASEWLEANGLEVDAFRHAAAAGDVERAERLIEGGGLPLYFRGALAPILAWLRSLPEATLNAHPSLWTTYVSVYLGTGHTDGIEDMLRKAETAIAGFPEDEKIRDLTGRIASTRALLAFSRQDANEILAQGRRALACLHPDNRPYRASLSQTMAFAYLLRGDREEARQAYERALAAAEATQNVITIIMACLGIGALQQMDNRLPEAAATFRRVVELAADIPFPVVSEAYAGLARISCQWNQLDAAREFWRLSLPGARQLANTDRVVASQALDARLRLAEGDLTGALEVLSNANREAREHDYFVQILEIAAHRVAALLKTGRIAEAVQALEGLDLPGCQVRICLAEGNAAEALEIVARWRAAAEQRGWADEILKAAILESLTRERLGETERAVESLEEALRLAEPGGFIRLFLDEGEPMARLLDLAGERGIRPEYVGRLRAAFGDGIDKRPVPAGELVEPLSERELEVLRLVALGLSNGDICERLFLAMSTVKGHNQRIFEKLQVQRRTEAVARARELGIL